MSKSRGFTLIEVVVALAILTIIMTMSAPMMTALNRSNKVNQELNQLDINLGRTIDVFKRAVRSSQPITSEWKPKGASTTGQAIYLATDKEAEKKATGTTGSAILINVPKEEPVGSGLYKDEKVIFYYDSANERLMLNSTMGTSMTTSNPVVLAENIIDASFSYGTDHIATIYLKIKLDPNDNTRFKEIRDAAVTRINIQF